MTSLQENIAFYRRTQAILAGGALLLAAIFYLAIYRPSQAAAATLADQITVKRGILASNQSEAGKLPRVQMQLDDLRRKLGGLKKLPAQPDFAEFIREVTELSQKIALKKLTWQPAMPKKTDLYFEQPITFQFEGDFASVFTFVRDLEDMQRLTRIRGMDIRAVANHAGTISVSLTVNFYYAGGG